MTAELLEQRLQIWADWYAKYSDGGLGYPKRSIEARLREEGGVLIRGSGLRLPPSNSTAEVIEKHVQELAQQNLELATALRCHYFSCGALRKKAETLGISHTQLKLLVTMAKHWLLGRMSG